MGEIVQFASNGQKASGYLAVPKAGKGHGVVVIQEWWGLVPHIKDVADRLAAEGFVALAPDLYHGQETTEPDHAGKMMMAMDIDGAVRDMKGAVDFLAGHVAVRGQGIATIGFCMGGGLVLWLACLSDKIVAAAPFYGVAPWPGAKPDFKKTKAAFQGHYAEHDDSATPELAKSLEAELRNLGREADFYVYPGTGHAFFNDTRSAVHNADASALAWERVLRFLRAKLGS